MRKYGLVVMIIISIWLLSGCRAIDPAIDALEVSGYDVIKALEQPSDDYILYEVYDMDEVVAYMYEFPTFRAARDYYETEALDQLDDGWTWITHNQLIVGSYDQDVIDTIVN